MLYIIDRITSPPPNIHYDLISLLEVSNLL